MEDHNSPEAVAKRATQEDPIVMYLIVRESLNMSIGKTAAQCAHASQMLQLEFDGSQQNEPDRMSYVRPEDTQRALEHNRKNDVFRTWLATSFRKVVLRADDKEWIKVKAEFIDHVLVVDAGLTEIVAGSETVIGLWPMYKSQVPKVVKKLQVLK